jgi:hypothetical protein
VVEDRNAGQLRIPAFLHEVFGETQSRAEIALILVFGALGTLAVILLDPWAFDPLPLWRAVLAALVAFDIFAGAVANLTQGTNDHYARKPAARWVFIAVHLHLVAFAWLIGEGMFEAVAVWLYTVAAASIVNLLAGRPLHRVAGGTLFAFGAVMLLLLGPSMLPASQVLAVVFMFKVIYAFAVDHRAQVR